MRAGGPIGLTAAWVGLGAALAAWGLWAVAGPSLDPIEWRLRDRWAAEAPSATTLPQVLLVVRDPASEKHLGASAWDRAVVARGVGALARAGAAAIGIDVPLGQPSAPGRGGAASDALLAQATDLAGNVVALAPAALAPRTSRIGHALTPADPDGIVRRVPLFVEAGERRVPAFGLALAATARGTTPEDLARALPVGGDGRLLVALARPGALLEIPFGQLWDAVQDGDVEGLRRFVEGRAVVLLTEPPRGAQRVAEGASLSDMAIQARVADAILSQGWMRVAPAPWAWAGTAMLAVLAAAAVLRLRWWLGLLALVVLVAICAAGAVAALVLGRLVLPAGPPALAIVLAGAGAVLWRQLHATGRIRDLEGQIGHVQQELAAARGALVRQETAVESLEEDLEAARVAVARSAGAEEELGRAAEALRAQLAGARGQEERTRRRLADLERELGGLRAADAPAAPPGDAEQAELARQCAEMGIVTRDPAVLALFRDLGKAARATLPILLLGEPGTGKELFARAAHRLSARGAGPFVTVNMGAIPAELFESELFGHVRGSFTGAVADRRGHFEGADGGTIFLDEIGDLRPDHQAKLLRVLQDRSFHRVGATRPSTVDVRVVAATNRDLEEGVAEGWFRGDLYFRLKGMVLRLPPLRERRDDVPLLATRFTAAAVAEMGRDGLALSPDALVALTAHEWPGNVRELEQCLRQAVALAEGPALGRTDLRLRAPAERAARRGSAPAFDPGAEPGSDGAVLAALRRHGFDMQATARDLGWDRSTVTQRLKGMGFRALVESAGDPGAAARSLAGEPALSGLVETKLREYTLHLERTVGEFDSAEAALAACRRRFKNLPERHFRSLESLVRQHFDRLAR